TADWGLEAGGPANFLDPTTHRRIHDMLAIPRQQIVHPMNRGQRDVQRIKANTTKKRTHSLYRQGLHYYNAIPMMREEKLVPLVEKFAELVRGQAICIEIFGVI